ncbi:GNAT family N-acetyltransferase [Actinocorallia sp. A-T 12471]|uniref:GNAT family N-acetyltransferase n=1 Tax=Actinocorallia sp. A-T 12471 TaxID=3089813 RepID=UPI0029D3C534|nr:GNAT family N-acetyltransferase [Actinocorallia sp. A-T 12471]MDX6740967.1 GNAT family N-acetyltransferase [Actinocorallia sp. A-T 12471]
MITFRRLREPDFPLVGQWLAAPHVRRWWNHDPSPEAVIRDFGPTARDEEPAEDFIALLDNTPLGIVQRCLLASYPEDFALLNALTPIPPAAATLDYLIGAPENTARGLGPAMIHAATTQLWHDYPTTPCIIIPIVAANRPSWRSLEKSGYHRLTEGNLPPDNPQDPPLHYLYHTTRPH